ncbi:unnamed protein product [Urochloa humidicola]
MVKEEQKNQERKIAVAHVQESTEIAEEPKPNHHDTELCKANIPDSLLMAEQTEQPSGEYAKTHVPGSPVTIPVTMATTDGNSNNSPNKPESAQGFL